MAFPQSQLDHPNPRLRAGGLLSTGSAPGRRHRVTGKACAPGAIRAIPAW